MKACRLWQGFWILFLAQRGATERFQQERKVILEIIVAVV